MTPVTYRLKSIALGQKLIVPSTRPTDVPTCEDFFCRRGTNCYIRFGSPVCLPNTCRVRQCEPGLTCIDTEDGALCRQGERESLRHTPRRSDLGSDKLMKLCLQHEDLLLNV